MIIGKFNEKLKNCSDKKLIAAYEELQVLSETGAFPSNAKAFRELAIERQQVYNTDYSLDATRSDIWEEIARRWYCGKQDDSIDANIDDVIPVYQGIAVTGEKVTGNALQLDDGEIRIATTCMVNRDSPDMLTVIARQVHPKTLVQVNDKKIGVIKCEE